MSSSYPRQWDLGAEPQITFGKPKGICASLPLWSRAISKLLIMRKQQLILGISDTVNVTHGDLQSCKASGGGQPGPVQ